MSFRSTKIVDGFSTCFRQWKADGTHCKHLHGYAVYFKLTFEGELDHRNWVSDFGFMKRSNTIISFDPGFGMWEGTLDQWFKLMFDHTTVIAADDPMFTNMLELHEKDACNLRILPVVGCEIFAKLVFDIVSQVVTADSDGRVRLVQVECFEHEKNSAIYYE